MDPLITQWLSAMLCFPQAGLLAHSHCHFCCNLECTNLALALVLSPFLLGSSLQTLHHVSFPKIFYYFFPCSLNQTFSSLLLSLFTSLSLICRLLSFCTRKRNYQTLVFLLDCSLLSLLLLSPCCATRTTHFNIVTRTRYGTISKEKIRQQSIARNRRPSIKTG